MADHSMASTQARSWTRRTRGSDIVLAMRQDVLGSVVPRPEAVTGHGGGWYRLEPEGIRAWLLSYVRVIEKIHVQGYGSWKRLLRQDMVGLYRLLRQLFERDSDR